MRWQPITIGERLGRLVVVEQADSVIDTKGRRRQKRWRVRCDCGVERILCTASLRTKRGTRSCGCGIATACRLRAIHNEARVGIVSPEHRTWSRIKGRCYNINDFKYDDYGGRGITVCERWRISFVAFLADMGRRPDKGLSIDRIDNDGGYWCGKAECPECGSLGRSPNCRWATRKEQARNKRTNRLLIHDGDELCVAEWAEKIGVQPIWMIYRLNKGWSLARILREVRSSAELWRPASDIASEEGDRLC